MTARQLRLGLLGLGIRDSHVRAAIAGIADETAREAAEIEWEYATIFPRDHALVASIGAALGLTDAQIDAAWAQASTL